MDAIIESVHSYYGHKAAITTVLISTDNAIIVSGSYDKTIKLWSVIDNTCLYTFENAHTGVIKSLALTSDNRFLCSASSDDVINIFDLLQNSKAHTFQKAHKEDINKLILSSDDKMLFSAGEDRCIRQWDLHAKVRVQSFEKVHQTGIQNIALSPCDKIIISVALEKSIKIWNVQGSKLLHTIKDAHSHVVIDGLEIAKNGQFFVSSSADKTIKVWDLTTYKNTTTFQAAHEFPVSVVAISNDSRHLISASGGQGLLKQGSHSIKIWNIQERKQITSFVKAHEHSINTLRVSADNSCIISGSGDSMIKLWDVNKYIGNPSRRSMLCHSSIIGTRNSIAMRTSMLGGNIDNKQSFDQSYVLHDENQSLLGSSQRGSRPAEMLDKSFDQSVTEIKQVSTTCRENKFGLFSSALFLLDDNLSDSLVSLESSITKKLTKATIQTIMLAQYKKLRPEQQEELDKALEDPDQEDLVLFAEHFKCNVNIVSVGAGDLGIVFENVGDTKFSQNIYIYYHYFEGSNRGSYSAIIGLNEINHEYKRFEKDQQKIRDKISSFISQLDQTKKELKETAELIKNH